MKLILISEDLRGGLDTWFIDGCIALVTMEADRWLIESTSFDVLDVSMVEFSCISFVDKDVEHTVWYRQHNHITINHIAVDFCTTNDMFSILPLSVYSIRHRQLL